MYCYYLFRICTLSASRKDMKYSTKLNAYKAGQLGINKNRIKTIQSSGEWDFNIY